MTREQAAQARDIHALFTSELGRRVLGYWEADFNRRRSYVDGDPHATSFREGQRDFYLQILDVIALVGDPQRLQAEVEGLPEEIA